ncbi:MAG: fibronectin type III domain-containing protein, partial [Proteobacteria bacterium]|nr:fibronectin type III domain-containing protein [Pseudomonadota bacterium]
DVDSEETDIDLEETDIDSEPPIQKPSARLTVPTRIRVKAGDSQVTISWNGVNNAESYNIYWNATGEVTKSEAEINNTGAMWFKHTALSNDTSYYYRVSSVTKDEESDLSIMAKAVPATTLPILRQDGTM